MVNLDKIKNTQMMFILGKGRSGTSLLQNLLDSHPQIIGPPESRFLVLLYPRFAHIKVWKEKDILNFVKALYLDPAIKVFWSIDKEELTRELMAVREQANYGLLCKLVYYQMGNGKENIVYISDKNPDYVLFTDTILKVYPDAKFIHIVREPRDNMYSSIISFNMQNPPFWAQQWLGFCKVVEKFKQKNQGKCFTVLYENLAANTEEVMKGICTFLNIPYNAQVTQNSTPAWLTGVLNKTNRTEADPMVHKSLTQPVNTSNIGKWKNKMDPEIVAITEIITGDYAHKTYGYDINQDDGKKVIKNSGIKFLWPAILYFFWERFKRAKFRSLRFNLFYSKIKRRMFKDMHFWDYF
jgi:protein-tyrosine sulfotransferase